jgi:hypothetical protein
MDFPAKIVFEIDASLIFGTWGPRRRTISRMHPYGDLTMPLRQDHPNLERCFIVFQVSHTGADKHLLAAENKEQDGPGC